LHRTCFGHSFETYSCLSSFLVTECCTWELASGRKRWDQEEMCFEISCKRVPCHLEAGLHVLACKCYRLLRPHGWVQCATARVLAGTGKTSTVLAIARQLYGNNTHNMTLELNASDDRGISVVRQEIQDFASTKSVFSKCFKLIILDECDAMTKDAQFALRRVIEKYARCDIGCRCLCKWCICPDHASNSALCHRVLVLLNPWFNHKRL
jgi:hypothetical protein